jgi:predicted dehydrogenase
MIGRAPNRPPLRVGLIGYGLAGATFHAPLIRVTPDLQLTSIVTKDPERRARAHHDHPDAQLLSAPEELWARAADHDLIVVATPNISHAPLAEAAIDAGLNVVVDKPLAVTAAQGRSLVEHADAGGVLLTVFQNRRWDGDFLTVRKLLEEGSLGAVTRFESRFERWRPAVRADAWRERAAPEEAGGLLYDLGSHLIDQANVLFGQPLSVYAELDTRREGAQVDDDTFVALTYAGGVRAHLWMSAVAAAPGPRFRVLGLSGAYEKHGLDPQEDALRSGLAPDQSDWGREVPDRWGTFTDGETSRQIETSPGAYPKFYARVARALRESEAPPVDPMDAVRTLEVIEAARRSAMTGTTVPAH